MTFTPTVGYVRGLKINSLAVWCAGKRASGYPCHHCGTFRLDGLDEKLRLSEIERRFVCTACGAIGAVDARPNWTEIQTFDPRPNWSIR